MQKSFMLLSILIWFHLGCSVNLSNLTSETDFSDQHRFKLQVVSKNCGSGNASIRIDEDNSFPMELAQRSGNTYQWIFDTYKMGNLSCGTRFGYTFYARYGNYLTRSYCRKGLTQAGGAFSAKIPDSDRVLVWKVPGESVHQGAGTIRFNTGGFAKQVVLHNLNQLIPVKVNDVLLDDTHQGNNFSVHNVPDNEYFDCGASKVFTVQWDTNQNGVDPDRGIILVDITEMRSDGTIDRRSIQINLEGHGQ